jgi:hypothetical protein
MFCIVSLEGTSDTNSPRIFTIEAPLPLGSRCGTVSLALEHFCAEEFICRSNSESEDKEARRKPVKEDRAAIIRATKAAKAEKKKEQRSRKKDEAKEEVGEPQIAAIEVLDEAWTPTWDEL